MTTRLLLSLLVSFFWMCTTFNYGLSETYYVVPLAKGSCPEEGASCMTLSQYANQSHDSFDSNTTLILLPGNHSLDSELVITNVTHLTISASLGLPGDIIVTCSESARFRFEDVSIITISDLTFLRCVDNRVLSVDHFTLKDCTVKGHSQELQGGAFTIIGLDNSKVFIANSLFVDNVAVIGGAVHISGNNTEVTFVNNTFISNYASQAGGAVALGASTTTRISSNTFINNTVYNLSEGRGGALVGFEHSQVVVDGSTFISNTANIGGGISCYSHAQLFIHNCTFMKNIGVEFAGAVDINSATADTTVYFNGSALIRNTTADSESYCLIENSVFNTNTAGIDGGAVLSYYSMVTINNCTFLDNEAFESGSAVNAVYTSIDIEYSTFIDNKADTGGLFTLDCSATLANNVFHGNTATSYGGAIYLHSSSSLAECSDTTIVNSTFSSNFGGAIYVMGSNLTIENGTFCYNNATTGGAVSIINNDNTINTIVSIKDTTFKYNNADLDGGAVSVVGIFSSFCSGHNAIFHLSNSVFAHNKAIFGAVLALSFVECNIDGLTLYSNFADNGVMYISKSMVSLSGITTVANNYGSMYAFSSNVTFKGQTSFMNNSAFDLSGDYDNSFLPKGGAITSFQSKLIFQDAVLLKENKAVTGGAILSTESKIFFYADVTVDSNSAVISGGGIYAYQSEINVWNNVKVTTNAADLNGGGIHAISSLIKLLGGSLTFIMNNAVSGGGVFLEVNSKLYIIKSEPECFKHLYGLCNDNPATWLRLEFTGNSADHGGAIFVADETNYGTCFVSPNTTQSTTSECFFQVLSVHQISQTSEVLNIQNVHFSNNTATVSGENVFGGLLDRCKVSVLSELFIMYPELIAQPLNVVSYLFNVSNLEKSDTETIFSISSNPVQLCFCRDGQPDCSYQPPTVYVMKGRPFNVSLVAVDQVNNTVPYSTIRGSLSSGHGRLSEGQSSQLTNENCTELQYNAFSPCDNETLLLYAEGPCNDTGISKQSIHVKFRPCQCPIGFEPANISTECDCKCDSDLAPYITTECFQENQTVLRKIDIWFTFINTSNKSKHDIFVYPHCPFDYCYPPSQSVYINLNIPDGSDQQCAFNRSGVLCGSCQEGFSLSLGSSSCMPCSNHWLALLIPFTIAGIVLVLFLSVLNLTVLIGTINGLIFYANIVIANHSVFFQFNKYNFLTVFVSWINLDFGFETCFYNGMDGYAKLWLQLVFPTYIIAMVTMVIIISEHSEKFSRLVFKINRNPVAVLATLILLSYAKLLRTIIAALSFTTLEYPDGSHETVWLYDANIPYLEGKHIPLFITAVVILLVGVTFTLLLFLWQWLLKLSNLRAFCWLNNTRLKSFMDIYHAPYKDEHKYWTGLLLLVRVLLYIVSSFDHVIGDARVNLLSTICVVGGLMLLKEIQRDKTYKEHVNNLFESCFTFNLLIFASATYQFRETNEDQTLIAFISISIAFITFVGIVIYHLWLLLKLFLKSQTLAEVWHTITSFNRQQPRIFLTDCNDSSLPETSHITDNTDLNDDLSLTRCTYSEMDGTPLVPDTDHAYDSKNDAFPDGSHMATNHEEIPYTAINTQISESAVVQSGLGKLHQHGGHPTTSKTCNDTIELSMLVEDKVDDNDSTSGDETMPLLSSVVP